MGNYPDSERPLTISSNKKFEQKKGKFCIFKLRSKKQKERRKKVAELPEIVIPRSQRTFVFGPVMSKNLKGPLSFLFYSQDKQKRSET